MDLSELLGFKNKILLMLGTPGDTLSSKSTSFYPVCIWAVLGCIWFLSLLLFMEFYFQLLHLYFLQGSALRTRSFRDQPAPGPGRPACLCSSWWSGFLCSSPRFTLYLSEMTSGTAPHGRGSFFNFKDHINLENA